MKRSKSYRESLLRALKDPLEAAEYINAALEEGDAEQLLVSLRNVAEAQGGFSRLSHKTKLNRGNLYKILSKHGNPELRTLENILGSFGLRVAVVAEPRERYGRAAA